MWTGIPGTIVCDTYCCRACGEQAFVQRDGDVMTMAEHATWRDAKQMRLLADPGSTELPKATVRSPGQRARLDRT